jgi:hypothetical protein
MPPNEAASWTMECWEKFRFKLKRDVLEACRAGNDGRRAHERIVRKSGSGFPLRTMRLPEKASDGSQKCIPLLGPMLEKGRPSSIAR